MKKVIILLLVLACTYSCKKSNNMSDFALVQIEESVNEHAGKRLAETLCYTCHSPNAEHDTRLAPPMMAVKKHYIKGTTSQEEFTENLKSWVANPNEADAKMFGAVKRFGVMPKANFNEQDIDQIADYLYNTPILSSHGSNKQCNQHKKGKKNCNHL